MDQIPLLCALTGIILLSNRMHGLATVIGIVGLVAMIHAGEQLQRRPGWCRCRACKPMPTTWEPYNEEEIMNHPTVLQSAPTPDEVQQPLPEEPLVTTGNETGDDQEEGELVEEEDHQVIPQTINITPVCEAGEYVSEHTVVGFPRRSESIIRSPNIQLLERQRLPVSSLTQQRLRRIGGRNSLYRSTTGQTSSFGR